MENYEALPQKVKDIIDSWEDSGDLYVQCRSILDQLEAIGWTADYGLDGMICDVKPQSTQEARKTLEAQLTEAIQDVSQHFSANLTVRLETRQVLIGEKNMDKDSRRYGQALFGSEVTIYPQMDRGWGLQAAEMNAGTMGTFDPLQKDANYWRTIHQAACINHWQKIASLVTEYCTKYQARLELGQK